MILYHKDSSNFSSINTVVQGLSFNSVCEKLLVKIIDPKEQELNCQLVGNFFMCYCEFYANKRSPEMLTALVRKLNKCAMPSTNQGIVIYLSFLIQTYSPDMLLFLKDLQVDKKNGLKILMDHWLLHQPKFNGELSKLHSIRGLIHIYRYKIISEWELRKYQSCL